ncbi:MAG TPA: helix-turn-helix domain-containing protein [Methanocellaceae archaeon]
MSDDDKLLVIPLGEESKAITQTISNDTAMRILDLLAETPLSTSAIAKRLDIPLTTAQYNMEKLIEAGLAKVDKTKYSEKGREVKMYAPARRFIVIVPEKTTGQAVIEALKKYLVMIPIALVASIVVEYLSSVNNFISQGMEAPASRVLAPMGAYIASANQSAIEATGAHVANGYDIVYMAANESSGVAMTTNLMPAPLPKEAVPSAIDNLQQTFQLADPLHHAGVWFFLGCMLILAIIAFVEYARIKKIKMPWTKK